MTERTTTADLTEDEHAILEFARYQWKYPGARDQAIRDRFDCTAISYDQRLNALLDKPAAEAAYPMLVHRLQRLREQRKAARNRRTANT